MSFLDVPQIPPEITSVLSKAFSNATEKMLSGTELEGRSFSEHFKEWAERTAEGETLAINLGLTPDHIDALLSQAHDLIQVGALAKAREKLLLVLVLDQTEERAHYAIAATFQMEQRYAEAGRAYVGYVMLKPLDPIGYLRIGECLLGDGSAAEAMEFFVGARDHARELEDEQTVLQVERLIDLIKNREAIIRN